MEGRLGWVAIGTLVHYKMCYIYVGFIDNMAKIYIWFWKSYDILVMLFSGEQKQFAPNACAD